MIEEDLIEEIARLHGYEHLSAPARPAYLDPRPRPEGVKTVGALRNLLAARGWQEIVTYSFTDPALDALVNPAAGHTRLKLDNPIAETLGVMRTRLLPGLIQAWTYNHQRQRPRVRLFELGAVYVQDGIQAADQDGEGATIVETRRLAGLAAGPVVPEQWGAGGPERTRKIDFHDLRGTVEALLGPASARAVWTVEATDPALHPGRAARITLDGETLGVVGELHPALVTRAGWPGPAVVFDLDAAVLARAGGMPVVQVPSEFPATRRDLALEVADTVPAATLVATARAEGGEHLRQVVVFDEYRGGNLEKGNRSVALGLIFQADSRTLEAAEIDTVMNRVMDALATGCAARVRAS